MGCVVMLGGNGSSLCGDAEYAAVLECARFLWLDRFFEVIHASEATQHKRLLLRRTCSNFCVVVWCAAVLEYDLCCEQVTMLFR